jgi:two-component system, OmpR family, response regulator|tara:strand:+ start:2337 stop:3005 length:669 start_codon:yes stop_codon:yes gene_type:complete
MIEDDAELAEILGEYLNEYNIKVTNFLRPELGIKALNEKKYDLLILDLSLPDIDGIDVCKMIRKKHSIPIIISSARSYIGDKIACFSYGADDFMPKPYDTQELIYRIKSILRRCNHQIIKETKPEKEKIFTFNESKMEISKNSELLNLTNAEYYILLYMIKKNGFVLSRHELLSNVESIKYESSYKSIDVLIGRVRSKIEENVKKPKYILSIRGLGYKFINE